MEPEGDANDRRSVLALLSGAGLVALVGGATALSNRGRAAATADAVTTVGPGTRGLADDERERYVDRMAESYGSQPADAIVPDDAGLTDLRPGIALGERVWDGERSLAVTDSAGAKLAESDNYAAIYEDGGSSSSGEEYVYWLWSSARPSESGELRELRSHVDVTGGGEMLVYDPGGDGSDDGTIGPHPEKTGMDTDEFAVRWQGEHDARQLVTGTLSTRRGDDDERGFEWAVHLEAATR